METGLIYKQFHQQLLGYVRTKVSSKEDAEDILQNVFIKISSSLEQLSDEVKVKGWIYAITRNAVIDYYRLNVNRKKIALIERISDDLSESNDPDPTQGLDKCVAGMIELLPEQYRDIITDSEIQGIPQKALAEKYNMAYPSMRSRIQRGRQRLKQIFYHCCRIDTDKRGNVLDVQHNQGCGSTCSSCES